VRPEDAGLAARTGDLLLSANVLAIVAGIVLKVINALMVINRLLGGRYFDVRGRRAVRRACRSRENC
jgi:hypothetical protein